MMTYYRELREPILFFFVIWKNIFFDVSASDRDECSRKAYCQLGTIWKSIRSNA